MGGLLFIKLVIRFAYMDNLRDRIVETERQFDEMKAKREQLLQEADNCMTEMNKLQGEWRLLDELLKSGTKTKANKKVAVIDAVPEEDK